MDAIRIEIPGITPHESTWPTDWSDLTDDQLAKVGQLHMYMDMQSEAAVFALICIAANMPDEIMMNMPSKEMVDLYEAMDWAKKELSWKQSRSAKLWFLRSPYPGLSDVTLARYQLAVNYDKRLRLSTDIKQKKKALRRVFSMHYRLRGLPFKMFLSDIVYHLARFIPKRHLYIALMDNKAMRTSMMSEYRDALATDSEPDPLGTEGLITFLAGEKFGTPKQVANTRVRLIMTHLYQVSKQPKK